LPTGRYAAFKELSLRDLDLSSLCLAGADLSGCEIGGASFNNADLSGANLQRDGALKSVDFTGANLQGAPTEAGAPSLDPPVPGQAHCSIPSRVERVPMAATYSTKQDSCALRKPSSYWTLGAELFHYFVTN
jgi:uncharacterized protein YjbI with pentapeptide repeats